MKSTSKTSFWLIAVLVVAIAAGCGDDTDNSDTNNATANNAQADAGNTDTGNDDAGGAEDMSEADMEVLTATWDDSVGAIFETRCAGCHAWSLDYDLVTVETVTLREQIVAGHGNLTDDEYDLVLEWIDSGTPRE